MDKDDKKKPVDKQLLDKKAEEYLRESGNIEDYPNPEEEDEQINPDKAPPQEKRDER